MKKIIFTLFIFLNLSLPQNIFAQSIGMGKSIYTSYRLMYGVGTLFRPGSFRFGVNQYEIGLLCPKALGVAVVVNDTNTYLSMGPAVNIENSQVGLFGAAGIDYKFFNFIFIKGELNTMVTFKNFSSGTMLVGAGIFW